MCYAQGYIMMIRNKRKHLGSGKAQWLEQMPGGQGFGCKSPLLLALAVCLWATTDMLMSAFLPCKMGFILVTTS